ncbi:MAG: GyrI-like domain-containing protein [Balneolaceae bacterium]|nr:GyrI-like domain-containing protein [Balneolaceae bacterium]
MEPRIEHIEEKKLVGKYLTMSLANNKTGELWGSFMPSRMKITNNLSNDLISLQVYPRGYYSSFNPNTEFVKWALAEVPNFNHVPENMDTFILKGGMYAVFLHKGSHTNTSTFEYIFREWIPASDYELDHRPHFEVLGEKYKLGDSESEEELWIPIRKN